MRICTNWGYNQAHIFVTNLKNNGMMFLKEDKIIVEMLSQTNLSRNFFSLHYLHHQGTK